MNGIFLNTAISLFTQSGGSVTSNLSGEVRKALRYGTCTVPTHWTFDGIYYPYSGTAINCTYAAGQTTAVNIVTKSNYSNATYYQSGLDEIQNYVYPGGGGGFSSNDSFTVTKMELYSGSTLYSSKDVYRVLDHGDEFYIYHRLLFTQGNSTDSASDNAVAEALTVGTCLPITGVKFTRSDTGSTTYATTDFAWGTYYEEYQATAMSDFMSSGSPTHIIMINQYNQSYATRSLNGTHTLGNRVKFKFDVNVSP